jgi:hypothetical protein
MAFQKERSGISMLYKHTRYQTFKQVYLYLLNQQYINKNVDYKTITKKWYYKIHINTCKIKIKLQ